MVFNEKNELLTFIDTCKNIRQKELIMKKLSIVVLSLLLPIMVFGSVFGLKPLPYFKLSPNLLRDTIYVPETLDIYVVEIGETEWEHETKFTFEYLPYHHGRPQIKHVYSHVDFGDGWVPFVRGDFEYNASQLCTAFSIGIALDEDELLVFTSGTVEYDDFDRLTRFAIIMDDDDFGEMQQIIEIEYLSDTEMQISVFLQEDGETEYQNVEIGLDSQNRMQSQTVYSSTDNENFAPEARFSFNYHPQDTSTIQDFIRYLSDNIVMLMLMEGDMIYGMVTEYTEMHWENPIWKANHKHIYEYDSDLLMTYKKWYSFFNNWEYYYRDSYTYDVHGNMIEEFGEHYQEGEYIDSSRTEMGYTALTDNQDINAPAISPISVSIYPQPFAGSVNILGESKAGGELHVEIFNLRGQKVRSFNMLSGTNFSWDGKDDGGKNLPSSVYFLRAGQGSAFQTKKLMKIK